MGNNRYKIAKEIVKKLKETNDNVHTTELRKAILMSAGSKIDEYMSIMQETDLIKDKGDFTWELLDG